MFGRTSYVLFSKKYMVVSCRIGCHVELALCCVVTDMVVLLRVRTSSVLCGLASV